MTETKSESEKKPKFTYDNPMRIVERHKAGEGWGLKYDIREYIYRHIKEREAYDEQFFECPRTIAKAFGCSTEAVHEAIRDQRLVVRTGADGDDRRVWIVCHDDAKRLAIKAKYKRTPGSGRPGASKGTSKTPGQSPGVCTTDHPDKAREHPDKARAFAPPGTPGESPGHQRILKTPPREDIVKGRPKADPTDLNKHQSKEPEQLEEVPSMEQALLDSLAGSDPKAHLVLNVWGSMVQRASKGRYQPYPIESMDVDMARAVSSLFSGSIDDMRGRLVEIAKDWLPAGARKRDTRMSLFKGFVRKALQAAQQAPTAQQPPAQHSDEPFDKRSDEVKAQQKADALRRIAENEARRKAEREAEDRARRVEGLKYCISLAKGSCWQRNKKTTPELVAEELIWVVKDRYGTRLTQDEAMAILNELDPNKGEK